MIERLLITSAAAWYLAYSITSTHGAFGMFERLREWRGGRWHGRVSIKVMTGNPFPVSPYELPTNEETKIIHYGLLDCIVCLIFWLALGIGYLQGLTIIESIAAAGLALWVHGYSGWRLNL